MADYSTSGSSVQLDEKEVAGEKPVEVSEESAMSGVSDGDDGEDGKNDLEATRSRALSRLSSAATEVPPDGGWAAWITCICAHFVFVNTWGFINSFGVFQAYYADLFAPLPPSTISWIGSVQTFLAFFLSAFTGRIADAGYFRPCFWTGVAFQLLGVFGASASTRYWQLMLAQGVCVGLGAGFLCCPTMSVVATFFSRRRGLALGVLTCGNVTGGVLFPVLARQLLPSIGFAWTLRVMGFLQLGMLGAAGLLIRTRLRPARANNRSSGPLLDVRALCEPAYSLYVVGMIFNIAGTFIIYYYIAAFGRAALSPPMAYTDSLNLLLVLNATGLIGRMSIAHWADHVGPLNLVYPVALVGALFAYTWAAVHTSSAVYVWVALYGVFGGAIQVLFPTGLASLTPDVRQIGQRIGLGFTLIGIAIISGPPAAGAMVTRMGGSYLGAQVFAGSLLVVGTGTVMLSKAAKMRQTGSGWWDKM